METSFRVVKMYSDRSGFRTIHTTDDFNEALVARAAAQSSAQDPHFIVAVPVGDSGSDYDVTLKEIGMDDE